MKKIKWFNILVFITTLISGGVLLHDFIVWGIIPLFSGNFFMLTYFGFLVDLVALFMLEASIQYIKEWFSK